MITMDLMAVITVILLTPVIIGLAVAAWTMLVVFLKEIHKCYQGKPCFADREKKEWHERMREFCKDYPENIDCRNYYHRYP